MSRNPHYQPPNRNPGRDAERIPQEFLDSLLERIDSDLVVTVTPSGTLIHLGPTSTGPLRRVAEGRTCGEAVNNLAESIAAAEERVKAAAVTELL